MYLLGFSLDNLGGLNTTNKGRLNKRRMKEAVDGY